MLSCLIMIRNPAVMPWSRAGHVLVVCRHAHDSYVAVLSCSCHVILNIYSSPPGNFLRRMVCTVRSFCAWLARAKPSPRKWSCFWSNQWINVPVDALARNRLFLWFILGLYRTETLEWRAYRIKTVEKWWLCLWVFPSRGQKWTPKMDEKSVTIFL